MFNATFHPKLLFPPYNHRARKRREVDVTTDKSGEAHVGEGHEPQVVFGGGPLTRDKATPSENDKMCGLTLFLTLFSDPFFRFSQPNPGKTVAVIGLGPIGQLSARIHRAYGCDVVGGDILDTRVNLLQSVGARSVNTSQGVGKAFAGMLPEGADVLVDATGVSALIRDFLKVAKELPWNADPLEGCRYILQGSYAGMVEIPYLDAFMKEVNFFLPRNLQRGDMEAVLKLMAEGRLDTRDLIDQVYLPEQAVEAYARVSDPAQVSGTLAFNWEEDV